MRPLKRSFFPWVVASFLYFACFAFLLWGISGCSTNPPPPLTPTPGSQTLSLQVFLVGTPATQFTETDGTTYIGTYRVVINTLDQNLIGNTTVLTTSPDTWTDYLQYDPTGWTRNHRIALPNSPQPQQFTGFQAITPGTISGNQITFALSIPDQYLGTPTQFLVSVITYIAPQSNPSNLHAISSLGPQLNGGTTINYISFNSAVSNQNSLAGGGNFLTYPIDFPDVQNSDYQNFAVQSMTVILK